MNLSEKHKALAIECGIPYRLSNNVAPLNYQQELALYTSKIQAEVLQSLKEQKPVAILKPYGRGWLLVDNACPDVGVPTPLYAQPIPAKEGYVLVPIEPTDEMLSHARKVFDEDTWSINGLYRAMIAAAKE